MDSQLTDEQWVGYLDAAQDRLSEAAEARHDELVQATYMGTVFASNLEARRRWHRARRHRARAVAGPGGEGLTGAALERALMMLAMTNPDIVTVRAA